MSAQQYSIVIDLRWCLDELLADKVIDQRGYNLVITSRRDKAQHPLLTISEFGLPNGHATDNSAENKLTLAWLNQWLAAKADMSLVRIDPLKVDVPAVTQLMSFEYARSQHILPIEVAVDEVVIGTDQPFYTDWHSSIEKLIKSKSYRTVYINPEQIKRYRQEFYQVTQAIAGANSVHKRAAADVTNVEALLQLGDNTNPDANDQHIVRVVDWLLQYAFEQRASDIHLEPRRETGKVRFRIDGVLHTVYEMPLAIIVAVTARIKILGRLNVAEKRKPQDGRLKTRTPKGLETELRLSTMPTAFGEKLVMRVFDPEVLVRSFAQLGLSGKQLETWHELTAHPNGIILVTGPTGSGKTTTLYSTLKQLATEQVNVCTIEDPIEMIEPAFNQMQVNPGVDLNFADGIRSLMRQDPDIIMVGEIRDAETANMAVQASLTGHLVLSTLHTNDAPSSITRLHDLGIQPFLTSATILGVMAQRLLRTLCPHCKKAVDVVPDSEVAIQWQELVQPWRAPAPAQIYMAQGCEHCRHTGYQGRIGLYEIMPLSNELKKLVAADTNLDVLKQQAYREGLQPLRLSGAKRISEGVTTIEEVMRVVPLN
ncbi:MULTISPECIES: GspE/PulE family protein [Psychrobacter]|uniref:GspE/PulE family protein n=1 Tax=Psychrobacter TaxID=497 RepID=UPI00086CAAF8|nr:MULTISPECIES: GspE/PulE family protein [Psychrobacter]MBA6245390.1 type II/IV secretion system protein [Psychrobacter sp. Urea-trap-18]MBA6286868.1 type II/IV secretion system protein [Psychrobacter sp. Urea-trap-16]MBA6317950.1 type II/IV secretion system protein [Psychrobacter sp. Urea-trap-20]MBA6335195.1 type II/IV secretion system protein [Psychrobacter sp. Urea-trap-19]OEH69091.1 MAG: type II secretion system protein E [Psychrobacter sp. B29-1]|tara:strand:+ start:31856 stop:33643 length:1788 start_codon:yes stop_codon:yes gene_type:complete